MTLKINSEILVGACVTWGVSALAKSFCSTSDAIKPETECRVALSAFKPSQLYVGKSEVSLKIEEFQLYDTGEKPCYHSANEALQDAGITVIQGLECDHFYVADGHHTLNAAWQYFEDPSYPVAVNVIDSYCHQTMSSESFWTIMINQSYAFPYAVDGTGDLYALSAQSMSEQVPASLPAMADWWYRSLAFLVKAWGDFHPLKDKQGHTVPFGKFFEGQCLKDMGVVPQNITRSLVGYAATLFDDQAEVNQVCQLDPAPERREPNQIVERDMSC